MSRDGDPPQGPAFIKPLMPARRDSKTSITNASPARPPVSPLTPSATLAQLASTQTPVHPPVLSQLDGASDTTRPQPPRYPPDSGESLDKKQDLQTRQILPDGGAVSVDHEQERQKEQPQAAQQQSQQGNAVQFMATPQPLPIDEDSNTDILAVRAALAVLQHQKSRSEQDIKSLQQLKRGLREDPSRFIEELASGKMREERRSDDPLHATFSGNAYGNSDGEGDPEDAVGRREPQSPPTSYPKIPGKQNVVRCPPVNWAKYHIVGEPLDKMHEEQRKRPIEGQPSSGPVGQTGNPFHSVHDLSFGQPAPEHHIYKPYDPVTDIHLLDTQRDGVQTRRSSKRP